MISYYLSPENVKYLSVGDATEATNVFMLFYTDGVGDLQPRVARFGATLGLIAPNASDPQGIADESGTKVFDHW